MLDKQYYAQHVFDCVEYHNPCTVVITMLLVLMMYYYNRGACSRGVARHRRPAAVEGKATRPPSNVTSTTADDSDIQLLQHNAPPVRPVDTVTAAGRPGRGRCEKRTAQKRYGTARKISHAAMRSVSRVHVTSNNK